MRGQVFELEGRTLFTMGGASSHDIPDGILDPRDPDFAARRRALGLPTLAETTRNFRNSQRTVPDPETRAGHRVSKREFRVLRDAI